MCAAVPHGFENTSSVTYGDTFPQGEGKGADEILH